MRSHGLEVLEDRALLSSLPYGAMPDDTGEFMLGDVAVTVVLMESSSRDLSQVNNNSETWTPASIQAVKSKIEDGLRWWKDSLAAVTSQHRLEFRLDYTYADQPVETRYEPIINPSSEFSTWIYDFLNPAGFNQTKDFSRDIRAFNNAQREKAATDWAFTIFVVNDEHDADGKFAPGSFEQAFAYSGGRCFVTPAGRPASTIAHETGHMFWAMDEYAGGASYTSYRGYYNTQNSNAWDNPAFRDPGSGQVQQPSIMASGANPGDLLYRAYQGHTSAPSTLAMIGWQDGDGDGIFDVLDVPQSLVGSGYYDASQGVYRFIGKAAVGTLMNRNPSGLQNDITINQIDRAEYRFDGGPWQTAVVYGTYEADLKLVLPVPAGAQSIEIRTRDDVTGVVSPTFQGSLLRPTSTLAPGINGFVWNDLDKNGNWDIGEPGLAAATVRLVDDRGQTLQLRRGIEPDDYPTDGTRLNQVLADVVLKAVGSDVTNDGVKALQSTFASTGARVFATASGPGSVSGDWTQSTRNLHMEFKSPVTTISIDAVGSANGSYGRLEIYGQDGKLLGRYTTKSLANGGKETMTLSRPTADIVYAVVRGHAGTTVVLDNLRFGPEAVTVTDIMGRYSLPSLPPGNYLVRVGVGGGQIATNPASAAQSASLLAGQSLGAVDFGVWSLTSRWQNPANRLDVNADGAVSPLDVLRVINYLNSSETGVLTAADPTPPYLDVSGDGMVTPLDALFIINALNQGVEGEAFVGGSGGAVGRPGGAEGEVLVGILPTFSSARSSSGGEITLPIPSVAMVDREPPSEVTSGLVTPAASNRMRPALDGEPPLGVQHPVRGTSEDIGSGVRQDGRQASGCRKNRLLEEEIDIDPFGSLGVEQSTEWDVLDR